MSDQPWPRLRAYRPQTAIAEKPHAMVELGTRNSRRRDYCDIHALCLHGSFEGDVLRRAIEATFARRRTAIPTELPVGLTGAFAETEGKAAQWNGFLQRLMQDKSPIDLSSVVESLARFFGPVLIAAGQGRTFDRRWPPEGPWNYRECRLTIACRQLSRPGQKTSSLGKSAGNALDHHAFALFHSETCARSSSPLLEVQQAG